MSPDEGGTGRDWRPGGRRVDPRLPAYLVAGFGALLVAMVSGRPGLAAAGAPFLVLAAAALVDREPRRLEGSVRVETDRVLTGDAIEGLIRVEWSGDAEVDVMLAGGRGVEPRAPEGVTGWALPAGPGPATLPFELGARSWGAHELGSLWVRIRRPGGLVMWERRVAIAPNVRVLPTPHRLDRLLRPSEPRAVSGMHVSRRRGHGTDFADLRPYRPGDRLRDLSWSTSARFGAPWVTVHHPERTGTVLLLLDTFFRDPATSSEALGRLARAAWAVASVHLRAQDRVGILARGPTPAWIPPQGGTRARWVLMEELLRVGGAAEDAWLGRGRRRRPMVPSDALVVAVTSLHSRLFLRELLHYRHVGHTTAALVVDLEDLLPESDDGVDEAACRLWVGERDAERLELERGGVPTALVSGSGGVTGAISTIRRGMRAQRSLRAGAVPR